MTKNNSVTDQEKREKQIVVKKLAEMEEELKVNKENKTWSSVLNSSFLFVVN